MHNTTLDHAITVSHTRNPLSMLLREYLITEILDNISTLHTDDNPPDRSYFGGTKAKGLCVKGSATLPAHLRLAGDIDMTVNMGGIYDPEESERWVRALLSRLGEKIGADIHFSDMSTHSGAARAEWLQKEKKFLEIHCVKHIHKEDIPAIREELLRLFDFTENDLKALNDFGPEAIAAIVKERIKAAEKTHKPYTPTEEELAGTGLSEAIRIDLTLKDRLNIFVPYSIVSHEQKTDARNEKKPFNVLTCANPIEEASDKMEALLNNKERARIDEPHAKDLVDLYIRTQKTGKMYGSITPYYAPREPFIDMVRVSWPTCSAFYTEPGPYFKKIDPTDPVNVKQIRNGLLKLQEHGCIGESLFGEKITKDNADHYAKLLLDHAWSLCEACFGVKRDGGTRENPLYSLHPPKKVMDYWSSCHIFAKMAALPPNGFRGVDGRADSMQRALQNKIMGMLEATYEPQDKQSIAVDGAINALCRADPTRQWAGYKKGATR